MTKTTTHWIATIATLSLLGACGGGDKPEVESLDTTDVNQLMQQQVERAKEVEIKDKKSLNKNARIANDYLQGMDKVATALDNVNDEASAKKAAEIMAEIGEEFDELAEELDGAGASRQRAMAAIMVSRATELAAVQQRLAGNMMRIQTQHPELMPVISNAMNEMNQ